MTTSKRVRIESLLEAFHWAQYERVIVLSPHLDDGAMSCGGLLVALRGQASRLMVTIGCGNPLPRSTRARARKGFATPASRRRADIAAMHSIDCDFVHLGFAECIYRRSPISRELIYRHPRQRWLQPGVDDAAHIEELYLVLSRLCLHMGPVLLLAPLGIGYHVDHTICAQLALRLAGPRRSLLFYEDFPYVVDSAVGGFADDPHAAIARLAVQPMRRLAVAFDLEQKTRLIQHYESEVEAMFGGPQGLAHALGARLHDGAPTEFFWQVQLTTSAPGTDGEQEDNR